MTWQRANTPTESASTMTVRSVETTRDTAPDGLTLRDARELDDTTASSGRRVCRARR